MRAGMLAVLFIAPLAGAQISRSPGFRLEAFEVAGGGRGMSSATLAAEAALPPAAGPSLRSAAYEAAVGFLGANDPMPTPLPVIYGVEPRRVLLGGGNLITLSGRNFTAAPQVRIGAVPASGTSLLSPTTIACLTPPLPEGPKAVEVTIGSNTGRLEEAVYVMPTLLVTRAPVVGARVDFVNVGPPGGTFDLYMSFTTFPLSTPFGMLLVDPFTMIPLLRGTPYPPPEGTFVFSLLLPPEPALSGLTVHFQNVAYHPALPPSGFHLSNGVTVRVQ